MDRLVRMMAGSAAVLCLVMTGVTTASAQQRVSSSFISVSVDRGQRSRVWFTYAIDEHCEVQRGFNMRVDRLPRNGEAAIERSTQYIQQWWVSSATGDMRRNVANCIGRSVPVLQLYYTPNPGFSGFDDMLFTITSAAKDRVTHREVKLSVR